MRQTKRAFEDWRARGGERGEGRDDRGAPDVIPIYLRLPAREIAYVKFVVESYEGIGIVRTLDRRAATLVILAVPDFEADARALVRALATEAECVETAPPADWDGDWLGFEPDA
jgi:uncharacterized protein DUF4911